jgi:PKD repeat protein
VATSDSPNYAIDTKEPTVAIEQKVGQADPTNGLPILFTVVFSEPVTGLLVGEFTLGGTAAGQVASLAGSGADYELSVDVITGDGTVLPSLAAAVALDAAGNDSVASTSADNLVTYDSVDPVTTPVSGPSGPSNNDDPTFEFTATDVGGTGIASSSATLSGAASAGPVGVTSPFDLSTVLPGGLVTNGAYTMAVVSTDNAGNVESTATWTWTYDSIGPTLTAVSIASDGVDPAVAKVFDTVTISFRADEPLIGLPVVTIAGSAADAVTDLGGNAYSATRVMQFEDAEGVVVFTIDSTDTMGNAGAQVTATTDASSVTFERTILPLPGETAPPTDPDGDGVYEDSNGNGDLDYDDVVLCFAHIEWITENEPTCCFDHNGNGRIDYADVVTLFGRMD